MRDRSAVIAAGAVGTLGALLVCIGEFAMQFSPAGGYESPDYRYFLDVSPARLRFGHFLGVLMVPLYIVGYWHVSRMLEPASAWLRRGVLLLAGYTFAVANVWLGQRIYLAQTVQARAEAGPELELPRAAPAEVGAVLVLVLSLAIVVPVWSGRTRYPRWMAAFTPIMLLAAIFASYFLVPRVGVYLLPAAMNVAHVIFFGLSTWVVLREPPQ